MFILIKKLKKKFVFSALIGIFVSFMNIMAMDKDIGKVGEPNKNFFINLNYDLNLNQLSRLYDHYFTSNTLAEQLVCLGVSCEKVNEIKKKFRKYKLLRDTIAVTSVWYDDYTTFHKWIIIPPLSSNVICNIPDYYKPGILNSGMLLNILPTSFLSDSQKQKIKDIDGFIFSEATLFAELFSNCEIRASGLHFLKGKCWEKGILKSIPYKKIAK